MTINYMHKVGDVGKMSGFVSSVLLRWHGGLFQAVYSKLLMYIFGYILLAFFYQFILKKLKSIYKAYLRSTGPLCLDSEVMQEKCLFLKFFSQSITGN